MVAARLRVMVRVRGDGKVEEVNDRCGRWWLEIDVGRWKERGVHNVCVQRCESMENGVDKRLRLMVRMTVRVRGDDQVEEVNDRCGRWWWEMVVGWGR